MDSLQHNLTRPPLHPLAALSLAAGDWLATGLNIASAMDAYWLVSCGAAVLAALGIFVSELYLAHASGRVAALKAGLVAPLIVVPFPFAGSVVALALLAWALVARVTRRSATAPARR